jgi:hypothetical protein
MSTPKVVFALYRPHAGKDAELLQAVAKHYPVLRKLELITDRAPVVVRAKDGSIVEVFEWVSDEAAEQAHEHPEIAAVWEDMGKVGDVAALSSLPEVHRPFPHFEPVELPRVAR